MFWRRRKQLTFAATAHVEQHPALLDDFIINVLDQPDGAFVSDESTLWDFHSERSNEEMFARIQARYGVDASDLQSGNIARILERIAASLSHPVD